MGHYAACRGAFGPIFNDRATAAVGQAFPLRLARAEDYAFQGASYRALSAGDRWIELDPVGAGYLAAIERGIIWTQDLPAQSAFHDASFVALLAVIERRRAMGPNVGDARETPRNMNACGSIPDEVARVQTTVHSVLIENGHQSFNDNRSIQQCGRM